MLIINYGITKSGSTLAFEIAKSILTISGHRQVKLEGAPVETIHRINFVDLFTVEKLERLLSITNEGRSIAVKTHSDISREFAEMAADYIREGKLRIHSVFRDYRDICLSMLDHGRRARAVGVKPFSEIVTIDDAIAACQRQVVALSAWSAIPGALHLEYDEIAFDMDRSIGRMNLDLGTNADAEAVRRALVFAFTERNKAIRNRHEREMRPETGERILAEIPPCRPAISGFPV